MPKPSTPALIAHGALLAGKYRLTRPLGEGAMGSVWAAINEATAREVALKLIIRPEPEFRLRLQREARALGSLKHRNIIDVYDIGQTESGDPFLVMQLLTGETIAELLARKRNLDPLTAARIGRDVARALGAAHAIPIIHRDLKPANIFLHKDPEEPDFTVKVLDFGVAKNLAESDGLRTALGGAVGSPLYMSPEQVRAQQDVDHRADLWTLGVVMFEMLTGARPFDGEAHEVFSKILGGEIPTVDRYVRRIDATLVQVVARCMRRAREERYQSAAEVAAALDRLVNAGALSGGAPVSDGMKNSRSAWERSAAPGSPDYCTELPTHPSAGSLVAGFAPGSSHGPSSYGAQSQAPGRGGGGQGSPAAPAYDSGPYAAAPAYDSGPYAAAQEVAAQELDADNAMTLQLGAGVAQAAIRQVAQRRAAQEAAQAQEAPRAAQAHWAPPRPQAAGPQPSSREWQGPRPPSGEWPQAQAAPPHAPGAPRPGSGGWPQAQAAPPHAPGAPRPGSGGWPQVQAAPPQTPGAPRPGSGGWPQVQAAPPQTPGAPRPGSGEWQAPAGQGSRGWSQGSAAHGQAGAQQAPQPESAALQIGSGPTWAQGGTLKLDREDVAAFHSQAATNLRTTERLPSRSELGAHIPSSPGADLATTAPIPSASGITSTTTPLVRSPEGLGSAALGLGTMGAALIDDRRRRLRLVAAIAGTILGLAIAGGALLVMSSRDEIPTPTPIGSGAAPEPAPAPVPEPAQAPAPTQAPTLAPSASGAPGASTSASSSRPKPPGAATSLSDRANPWGTAPPPSPAPPTPPAGSPRKPLADPCVGKTGFMLTDCRRKTSPGKLPSSKP